MEHFAVTRLRTQGARVDFIAAPSQQHAHANQIDLVLPEALLQRVKEKILDDTARIPSYQRVIMTLGQVLEGDFFTQYIKIGMHRPTFSSHLGVLVLIFIHQGIL